MGVSSFASYNSGLLRSAPTVDNPADEVGAGSAGEYAGKQAAGATQSESAGTTACSEAGSTSTTRVGRWMSIDEYNAMKSTGKVQISSNGVTSVANPADPSAFSSQAKTGTIYVEFDVPISAIQPGGKETWGLISGPGSLWDRLYQSKGLPAITEMPDAQDIQIVGGK